MASYDTSRLDPFQKEFVKLLQANAYRHRPHEVFRDFCELAAISLSNAVDRIHYAKREARYLEVIKTYTKEEAYRFPAMLAAVVNSQASTCCRVWQPLVAATPGDFTYRKPQHSSR